MIFKSGLITQASGSLGGLTASHNKGGMYLRARAIPVNPQSAQQTAVRNALSQLTGAWLGTLTQAQRDAWAVYAANTLLPSKLGDPRQIPPLAQYVRSNVPRIQAGEAAINDAPTIFNLPVLTDPSFAIDATADEVDVTFTDTDPWANEVGGHMFVYVSRPQDPTIEFFKGPYRLAGTIDGAGSPPTSPASLALPFPATADQKFFVQVRVGRADGRLSAPFRGDGIAA